jgi:hypothetical protein
VTAALAVGGGATGVAGAPVNADATFCNSCGALAGTAASWSTRGSPGTAGMGGGAAGSAAAVALSANATGTAPAAAIMLVASNLLVNFMVLPIR